MCWAESKYEFCRKCKEIKHNACAMISQNKTKLQKLMNWNRLSINNFERFILYTDNIRKYGRIYMKFLQLKHDKLFRNINRPYSDLQYN